MLKRIRHLLLDNALYIAIFITLSIAALSLVKFKGKVTFVTSSDKLGHAIAYCMLMLFWLLSFVKKQNFKRLAWYAVFGCFFYGIIIEALQGNMTSYRTASYLDVVANSIGILIAILIFHLFDKKNRFIKC